MMPGPLLDCIVATGMRIARRHGVTFEQLRRVELHLPTVVRARHEWIRAVHDSWGLSASETERELGIHRQTIMAAIRKGEKEAAHG